MPSLDGTTAVLGALVLAAIAGAVALARGGIGADFVIRHRPGRGTRVRGRVPGSKVGAIAEFFDRDLASHGPVAVFGRWEAGRNLRIRCAGRLSAFQRQRVRNFLVNLLR